MSDLYKTNLCRANIWFDQTGYIHPRPNHREYLYITHPCCGCCNTTDYPGLCVHCKLFILFEIYCISSCYMLWINENNWIYIHWHLFKTIYLKCPSVTDYFSKMRNHLLEKKKKFHWWNFYERDFKIACNLCFHCPRCIKMNILS